MAVKGLKIVSFNIWDLPLWYVADRNRRIAAIAQYLKNLDADIICIQESFDIAHRQLLHQILDTKVYYATDGMEKSRKVFYKKFDTTGGLVILSKFPITEQEFIPFPKTYFSTVEIFSKKGFLDIVVDSPYGSLRVINTHLHKEQRFFSQNIRLNQIRFILDRVDAEAEMPAFFGGDFNEPELHKAEIFDQAFKAKKFSHPAVLNNLPSYRLDNPFVQHWINKVKTSRRIDYILTRLTEKLNLTILQYEPVYLTPALSDHDPVVLHLFPTTKAT